MTCRSLAFGQGSQNEGPPPRFWVLGGLPVGFPCQPPRWDHQLGPPVPIYPFLGEGSPTKIDYREKGTLILTSQMWRTWSANTIAVKLDQSGSPQTARRAVRLSDRLRLLHLESELNKRVVGQETVEVTGRNGSGGRV